MNGFDLCLVEEKPFIGTYILNEANQPVREPSTLKWGKWFEAANRHVGDTYVGLVRISTVFLGLDHNYGDVGFPILFETMIFDGDLDRLQHRYHTWEEAEEGHAELVKVVEALKEMDFVLPDISECDL